jgi:eukaryotic-like serine/threonine-protein kinase
VFHPGDVIDGRYDVLGPLGQGGMGHVFRAQDRRLERTVALKVLRPHLTETDADRFRREIRALSRLNHPAIVSIYDLGEGEHVYFAMELVEGGPFTDLGPVVDDVEPFQALLDGAAEVAEALAYVHRLGMVHRDLTPRNILLGEGGRPKVMDFGLVQLTETSRQLTRTGSTLGTPQYMAPEQATGDATGAATDLYAFGAVLYRTVTGEAPFDAENDQAIMYQHVYHEPAARLGGPPGRARRALSALLGACWRSAPRTAPPPPRPSPTRSARCATTASPAPRTGRTAAPAAGALPERDRRPAALRAALAGPPPEGPQWPAGMAAADGFLLVGQRSDALAVCGPPTARSRRRFELDDEVTSPPLVHGGRVWVTTRDGAAAIAWPSGERAWTAADVEAVGLTALGADVLVARRDGRSSAGALAPRGALAAELSAPGDHAADGARPSGVRRQPRTAGSTRSTLATGARASRSRSARWWPPRSPPTASCCCPRARRAARVRPARTRWRGPTTSRASCWGAPAVGGRHVYVASWGDRLHALSLRSGDDVWSRAARPSGHGGTRPRRRHPLRGDRGRRAARLRGPQRPRARAPPRGARRRPGQPAAAGRRRVRRRARRHPHLPG